MKKITLSFILLFSLMEVTYASVVMIGTRVVYPADKKFVNLNFSSTDTVPSIMELWVSKLPDSDSKNSHSPFVVTPSIFRIDPGKGQSAKLIFTGAQLPADRESVFYLNFLQMPASDKSTNELVITFKSTVKVFYRPTELKQNIDNIADYISVNIKNANSGIITLFNNSEYYITPTSLSFKRNGKDILSIKDNKISMLAPFSKEDIKIKSAVNLSGSEASVRWINDLGGISNHKIIIK